MDCTRAQSLLYLWLDDELERDEHREVTDHLCQCDRCDARFRDEQHLLAWVQEGLAAPCPEKLRAWLLVALSR